MKFKDIIIEGNLNVKSVVIDYFKDNNFPHTARIDGDRDLYRVIVPGKKTVILHTFEFKTEKDVIEFLDKEYN